MSRTGAWCVGKCRICGKVGLCEHNNRDEKEIYNSTCNETLCTRGDLFTPQSSHKCICPEFKKIEDEQPWKRDLADTHTLKDPITKTERNASSNTGKVQPGKINIDFRGLEDKWSLTIQDSCAECGVPFPEKSMPVRFFKGSGPGTLGLSLCWDCTGKRTTGHIMG